jgi:hypothetical protein
MLPLIIAYLATKAAWSATNNTIVWWYPRKPIPRFGSPTEAWAYWVQHGNPYTGDPTFLGIPGTAGAGDLYIDPQRIQAAFEAPDRQRQLDQLSIDCDDTAGWHCKAIKQMPGYNAEIRTLVDAGLSWSHVIVVFVSPDGKSGAVDTNGVHTLPDLSESTLCAHWKRLYPAANYIAAVASPYPFA